MISLLTVDTARRNKSSLILEQTAELRSIMFGLFLRIEVGKLKSSLAFFVLKTALFASV